MMNRLLGDHSKNKSFEHDEYIENDQKAKRAVREFLDMNGYFTQVPEENFGVDIEAMRLEHHEVEIKRGWIDVWPENWKTIHIPKRKEKILKIKRIFFWVLSADLSKAWVINGKNLKLEYLEEVPNSKISSGEKMYCVPISKCAFIQLDKK